MIAGGGVSLCGPHHPDVQLDEEGAQDAAARAEEEEERVLREGRHLLG